MPYGPVSDVLPYIARRAIENRAVIAGADRERKLIENRAMMAGADRERELIGNELMRRLTFRK